MSLSQNNHKIGVIAGYGDFPIEVCNAAQKQELEVVLCAIKGEANPSITDPIKESIWVKLGELGKVIKFFKENNVEQVILCGKIHKVNLLKGDVIPDLEMLKLVGRIRNFKDQDLLKKLCDYLGEKGIHIIDSTSLLKEALQLEGVLSKKKLSQDDWADVSFGYDMAKKMADLDIGQTVVVKNKSVVAVEGLEGTDQAIARGGELAGKSSTVVKVARPNQDMRFDVPTIGPDTIESCQKANIGTLAFESGKTIILHSEKVIDLVNQSGMKLVSFNPDNNNN